MACSMFEKLDATQQGILKHASVLDPPFTVRTLASALPTTISPLPLLAQCMRFVEAGTLCIEMKGMIHDRRYESNWISSHSQELEPQPQPLPLDP